MRHFLIYSDFLAIDIGLKAYEVTFRWKEEAY